MTSDEQHISNAAPNQGVQGQFHGPVSAGARLAQPSQRIDGQQYNANRDITVIYQQAPPRAADPATLQAARARLAELPTETLPDPATLPHPHWMPFSRNPHFVGRAAILMQLAAALKAGGTAAIAGMGGLGKTNLATEFAYRYGNYFAGVFFLSFAEATNIPAEIARCGQAPGFGLRPDLADLPLGEQVATVSTAWQSGLPYLLIFDNLDDDDAEQLVRQWRPGQGERRLLLTTRQTVWSPALNVHVVTPGLLARPESRALLQQHRPTITDAEADAIAAELGDLPLALHLAGSYLERYRTSAAPGDYLAELMSGALLEHKSLQGWRLRRQQSPTEHDLHIGRTFALSYERLDPTDEIEALALQILARAAHFAPGEPIPRALLVEAVGPSSPEEVMDAEDALVRLSEVGLIEIRHADGAPTLHRLLARFVQETAQDAGAQAAAEQAIIDHADNLGETATPADWLPVLPHLRHATDAALPREDERAATLANDLGDCLCDMLADYTEARRYLERALAICEQVLSPQHPATAESLNNLGTLLWHQGDYAGARPYIERALAIREQVLGPQHPKTARSLNDLGAILGHQGYYARAQPYYKRALAIREQVLGPQHPATAESLTHLGALLSAQGEYAEARPLHERALAIREQVLGPQHPNTASSLNNLGVLLYDMGDYAEARPYYERTLAIWEQVLGPQHPDTATSLNNLGRLLSAQGDYAEARPYHERALAIREQVLGPQHPDTAESLTHLGWLLQAQGDYAEARPYYERALAIREQVLGPQHPHTANSLNNLGWLLYDMGDYAEARPYHERALAIYEQVLGPQHPNTATSLNNLGLLLSAQGEYAEARPYHERALAIDEAVYGPQHLDTASSLTHLGLLLQAQGEYVEARPYHERALAIYEQVLGPQHPHTATSLNNLGWLCHDEGNHAEAANLMRRALAILEAVLGPQHRHTQMSRESLATIEARLRS